MPHYERMAFQPGAFGRNVMRYWVEVISENAHFVLLRRVDASGEEIKADSYMDKDGRAVETTHLVSKGVILTRRPARMNLKYAELELVKKS